jgi:GR25 family glycosyltransferase involved in LPS biosynthesis
MIEHVYCINLKNDNSRKEFMLPQLEKNFSGKYTIIDALTPDDKIVNETYNILPDKHKFTAMSQIAICFSHLKCLELIYNNKLDYGAIIEDDIHIKDNFNNLLTEYFSNSLDINNIMKTKPCIIHLMSSDPEQNRLKLNKFNMVEKISNICFYIIKYRAAKILIDNVFPLMQQFDQYIYNSARKLDIIEYVASPLLGWDISSSIYAKYHTKNDMECKKYIKNESNNIRIKKKN